MILIYETLIEPIKGSGIDKIREPRLERGKRMEYAIRGVTWFWLFIPMPMILLLSIITLFTERRK